MKKTLIAVIVILVVIFGYYSITKNQAEAPSPVSEDDSGAGVIVNPISHATMVLEWNGTIIYTDPVGGEDAFVGQQPPDLVLITDIHGDHLDNETLDAVLTDDSIIVAPKAVIEELNEHNKSHALLLNNGETVNKFGFDIEAIPMYNLPESEDSRHSKGRGNGYVIELDETRVYVAGDTAGIPEMRELKNIDIAFVPMNLPYTMDVEEAADAVLDFAPRVVYPYHYRGQDGLSDVGKFKELVNAGNPEIEVVLAEWYKN